MFASVSFVIHTYLCCVPWCVWQFLLHISPFFRSTQIRIVFPQHLSGVPRCFLILSISLPFWLMYAFVQIHEANARWVFRIDYCVPHLLHAAFWCFLLFAYTPLLKPLRQGFQSVDGRITRGQFISSCIKLSRSVLVMSVIMSVILYSLYSMSGL